jgi:hypothetical protein
VASQFLAKKILPNMRGSFSKAYIFYHLSTSSSAWDEVAGGVSSLSESISGVAAAEIPVGASSSFSGAGASSLGPSYIFT